MKIEYYENGVQKFRTTKPTINGDHFSPYDAQFINNTFLHREDGPALIVCNSDNQVYFEEYYKNNVYHCLDGPARIYYYENCEPIIYFYINGEIYSKEAYDFLIKNNFIQSKTEWTDEICTMISLRFEEGKDFNISDLYELRIE